jgi:hypothetical protein
MFLAADSLEQLAASGAFGSAHDTQAAFAFAASWRHGMAGNSPVYMPGFSAVAAATWIWAENARTDQVVRYMTALLAACAIAGVTSPAGAALVVAAFEEEAGSAAGQPLPFADPRALGIGVYTLLTWTAFVVGCRLALHRKTFVPLIVAVPLTAGLVALRPWTVDDFTTIWWHRLAEGDMVAVASTVMVPTLAAYLYRRRQGGNGVQNGGVQSGGAQSGGVRSGGNGF